MGGKKKGGGKKKSKGGDDDGEIDQNTLNEILTAKVQALKARLVLEQERRDTADAKIDELRETGEEMADNMDEHKESTRTIVKKMTTIYKSMEKSYNEKIDLHEKEVSRQEQTKKQLKDEINQLQQAKEDMITQFEQTIFKLKERIDTMSSDFAKMLKTTYKKMQERIDDANQTYEADQPGMGAEGAGYGGPGGFGGEEVPQM